MRFSDPIVLGGIYCLSEVFLAFRRQAGTTTVSHDRHSLIVLWIIILVSIGLGILAMSLFPGARIPYPRACYLIGSLLFTAGIILRWYAIFFLGRFFTVDVAIAADHRVIDSGPYRFIRHPSYTGALLAFLGFGICLANWLSILLVTLPIFVAFLWRIRVEERALTEALGEDYPSYARRTKALIPFLY